MTTKEKILQAALTLFAEKGYEAVYVSEIAAAVGIKAPSLYKHYKSKQEIFNAILVLMQKNYEEHARQLQMDGNNPIRDAEFFSALSEDLLVKVGKDLFLYFLHDDCVQKFRKMLTLEQFRNPGLSELYTKQYFDEPLRYQSTVFAMLTQSQALKAENTDIMALEFYAPLYTLLTLCDRHPEREPEALAILERHIRQFSKIYKKETEK